MSRADPNYHCNMDDGWAFYSVFDRIRFSDWYYGWSLLFWSPPTLFSGCDDSAIHHRPIRCRVDCDCLVPDSGFLILDQSGICVNSRTRSIVGSYCEQPNSCGACENTKMKSVPNNRLQRIADKSGSRWAASLSIQRSWVVLRLSNFMAKSLKVKDFPRAVWGKTSRTVRWVGTEKTGDRCSPVPYSTSV